MLYLSLGLYKFSPFDHKITNNTTITSWPHDTWPDRLLVQPKNKHLFLKTLREKEKMLITRIVCFSYNVFKKLLT